jgi:hypothetical protein
MVFIGYEPGSKAWRFYNPVTKRVHVSHDAVFEEDRAWDWGDHEAVDGEPFAMEFISVDGANRTGKGMRPNAPVAAPMPDPLEAEAHTPPAPPEHGVVEYATPPTASPDIDGEAEDAPLRFRRMDDVLGPAPLPSLADRDFTVELLAAIGDEPSSAEEALKDEKWYLAMLEEQVLSRRTELGLWLICQGGTGL